MNIVNEMHNDFMTYSLEVNNNRSFPDARDGLKPVKRAIIWEMSSKGYTSNKPHVKSAKISGGVIGSWHPHGDGSVYGAMVGMSQDWLNNIPEVDWHGANGSAIGGPEAASARYTECRLSESVEEGMLSTIKKDTVDFIPNYSEDLEWPSVLPSVFPRLFVNGDSGIGCTIANEWEPGNLGEFTSKVKSYLKNGKVDCSDIYPDYPSGGVIINKKDIHSIYETGKGLVVLRAKTEIVDDCILITELPFQVYVEPLIQKIKDLVNGGKISGVEDIKNKSGDSGLLIEIECNSDPNVVLNQLFKLTELQKTFSANQMALVNGIPEMLNLKDYIKVYTDHNIKCIVREYQHDLEKAQQRLEIVDGLLKALDSIDDVIETIKKSKSSSDAKDALIKKFKFSEVQAQSIIDMKLGKLAHLEVDALRDEESDLNKQIVKCNELIISHSKQVSEFISRLDMFNKKFGYKRHTRVEDIDYKTERVVVQRSIKEEESFMVVLTKDNCLRRISLLKYRDKKDDYIIDTAKVTAKQKIVLISSAGLMYKLPANRISLGTMQSSGIEISTLLPLQEGETIVRMFFTTEKEFMFFITSTGNAKKLKSKDCFNLSKTVGSMMVKLDENEKVIFCELVDNEKLKVGSKTIDTSKFRAKGRGAGTVKCLKAPF